MGNIDKNKQQQIKIKHELFAYCLGCSAYQHTSLTQYTMYPAELCDEIDVWPYDRENLWHQMFYASN